MTEHIKMPNVTPIVRYLANGIQTVFSYPFPIFASEDLKVYIDGAEQVSGFTISGAGTTLGGSVTFDTAPADESIVTLERELPIERVTDFLEGGDFSAVAINNELDYLTAALQQVNRENDLMLRYSDHEAPGGFLIPDKDQRKNKALGFDGDGNPAAITVTGGGGGGSTDFTASGTGAVTRTSTDKFSDLISVKDFGAIGDGLTDDTNAIVNALAAHDAVLIPKGTFLITSVIELSDNKSIIGLGQKSIIKCQATSFNAIEIVGKNNTLQNFRIESGDVALKFYGKASECTQNNVSGLQVIGAKTGIQLDGYNSSSNPCYWNNFANILIEQPATNGVHLIKSGVGDTPNANRFSKVRVFSKGVNTSAHGIYVEHGAFNNSFVDCEVDLDNSTGGACVRLGAASNKTLFVNLYTESKTSQVNVQLDSGSIDTAIMNLSAESAGAAILDNASGSYDAYNAGSLDRNRLRQSKVTDLKATLMRFDTEFVEGAGTHTLDLSHSVHIANAMTGAMTLKLPKASTAAAAEITIKKVDQTGNVISVTEDGGPGPDGKTLQLGGPYDYATMISNGAAWYIKASNRLAGNTSFSETSGTIDVDMAVDTYLVSGFTGAVTMRLPPADATEAIGRTVTIKKTDATGNAVTVTEQGGNGPDQSSQTLSSQYDAVTVVSNGANWFVVSKYP